MRRRLENTWTSYGYCMTEMLLVLCLLGILLAVGTVSVSNGVRKQQARSAAQVTQGAAASAQTAVLWHGGEAGLSFDGSGLTTEHDIQGSSSSLRSLAPPATVDSNVSRWNVGDGILVQFLGGFASPDSGGSLYFVCPGGAYRITVRPESGLTVRSWVPR